jgi:hypothetical protein
MRLQARKNLGARMLLGTVAIVAILGCAKDPAVAGGLPSWVTKPPADTSDSIFGVGDGQDLASSKSGALAAIAGQLMTMVKSSIEVRQEQTGDDYLEEVRATVDAQVKDTALSHYQVKEVAEVGGTWFTLVELSRRDFISQNQRHLADQDGSLVQLVKRQSTQSNLVRFLSGPEATTAIMRAKTTVEMLRSIDPKFDGGDYMKRYRGYEDAIANTANSLRIYVKADDAASRLARDLSDQLVKSDIRASIREPSEPHSTVLLRSNVEQRASFGAKAVKLAILVTTLDERGAELASLERIGNGTSIASYDTALGLASKNLASECTKTGALKYLGLIHD